MDNKGLLFSIPASLLAGTILVGASQMTTLLPMAVSPNSNQQVLVKMPVMGGFQPVGFWGGIALAVGGVVVPILLSPKEDEPEYLRFQGSYQPPTLVLQPPTLATVGQPQQEAYYEEPSYSCDDLSQEQEEYQYFDQAEVANEPVSPIPVVFPSYRQPEPVEFLQNAKQQESPVGKSTPEDRKAVGLPDCPPFIPQVDVVESESENLELEEDIWGDYDNDEKNVWDESNNYEAGEDNDFDESHEEDDNEDESEPVVSVPPVILPSPQQAPVIAYSHRAIQSPTAEIRFEEPDICEAIAATNKPVILCSPPGTGKTSTIRAVIRAIFESSPQSEIHIVDRKNGSGKNSGRWMGLEKIEGVVVAPPSRDLSLLTEKINKVAGIVEKRRKMSVQELASQHDVWLILDDYLALYETAKLVLPKEQITSNHVGLCDIAFDGRELKVRIVIITHSPNCVDLGFSGGQKKSFAFFVLGFLDASQGKRADGGFGAISAALAQITIFPNKSDRDKLQATFDEVCRASIENSRPMFLTTMGTPRLGLMPDLSWTRTYQLPLDFSGLDSESEKSDQEDSEPDALDYLARFWDTHRNKD